MSFCSPNEEEQETYSATCTNHSAAIIQSERTVSPRWDFGSLLDAVANGEYCLLEIAQTAEVTAELRIDPHAYPYGGLGAFIALVEAHGMYILGINSYGKYLPRSELIGQDEPAPKKPWWKFW